MLGGGSAALADDGGHDGDPGGFVGHEAVEEDDEDARVGAGNVGARDGGAGFVAEGYVGRDDLFWDSNGLEGYCHF